MFITLCENRDNLQKYLKKFNIQSLIYYGTPLHLHKATKFLGYKKGSFPKAEYQAKNLITLPVHQFLNKKQINFMIKKIKDFYN